MVIYRHIPFRFFTRDLKISYKGIEMTLHTNIFEIKRGIEELLARYGENIFSKVKKLSIVYGDESYFTKENDEIYITATSLSMAYFALGQALLFNERGGHVRVE